MKIAHLITGLGLGGSERQLKALVTGKPEESLLQHIVISLKDEGVIGKQLADQEGVRLYCLNLHKSLAGVWQLYKILRREKPDVLQTWLYHADLVGLVIGKLARVPRIVWNIRCSNMDLSQYSRVTGIVVKILKVLSRFPDAIVTNSQSGQEVHKKLGYKPRRWFQIPNGIDTDLFQPNLDRSESRTRSQLGIPPDALVIGMLARVDPMKDYETFLGAARVLSTQHKNLYFIAAGSGTDSASWQSLPPQFLAVGEWGDVCGLLNAMDIMVLSSLGEGFPNVVGEAMACEIPAIVTDVGDAAILVQTPEQIIPPRDVDKLILALDGLLALSSQERKAMGQKSRKRVLNSYSLPIMKQRYASFYESLI